MPFNNPSKRKRRHKDSPKPAQTKGRQPRKGPAFFFCLEFLPRLCPAPPGGGQNFDRNKNRNIYQKNRNIAGQGWKTQDETNFEIILDITMN